MHKSPIVLDFLGLEEAVSAAQAQLLSPEDEQLVEEGLDALEDQRDDALISEPMVLEDVDAYEFLGHLEVLSHHE